MSAGVPVGAEGALVPFDLATTLRAVAGSVPSSLVRPEALAAVVDFTVGLPPVFRWAVLESRLTGDDPRVDLLVSITDADGSRADVAVALERPLPHASLERARPLLETWGGHRDPDLEAVRVLWMEWDAPFRHDRAPLQLLSIDPRFCAGPGGRPPRPTVAAQVAAAAAGYRASFGEDHDPAVLGHLGAAIAALPPAGSAIFTASLRPRGLAVDRLFVGLPRDEVLPWLARIGWPGDVDVAGAWLRRTIAPWETAYLQVEITPLGTGDYLGIEPQQTGQTLSELRERRAMLDALVAQGHVPRERADAVLAWPSEHPDRRLDGVAVDEHRSIHLKCVLRSDRAPEVKGYLGFHFTRR